MKNLNSLLSRFSKLLDKKTVIKEVIASIISANIGKSISTDDIFIEEGVLEIHSSPVVKNEIKIKEKNILSELQDTHNIYISRVLYK